MCECLGFISLTWGLAINTEPDTNAESKASREDVGSSISNELDLEVSWFLIDMTG